MPSDLRGKRVGNAEFQLTANVWVRGILADEHDVPVDSVSYLIGGQGTPGRFEKGAIEAALDITAIPDGRTLTDMPQTGEVEAFYGPRIRARSTAATVGYDAHRWIAQSLLEAFTQARDLAYEAFLDASALRFMSPWLIQHAEADRALRDEAHRAWWWQHRRIWSNLQTLAIA